MCQAYFRRKDRLTTLRRNLSSPSTVNQSSVTKITSHQSNPPNIHNDGSLNIPENIIRKLNEALQTLTVGPEKVSDDKSVRDAVNYVVDYVHSTNDAMYGEGSADAQYFGTYGRVFVVEEVDDEYVKENKLCKGYRTSAGEIGGLSKNNAPYRRRIHLLIDSKSGVYGCDNLLGDNYHYQIKQGDLKEYLYDAFTKSRATIRVAGQENDNATDDDAGIRNIPPTEKTLHDVMIYTAATPFVVSNTLVHRPASDEGDMSPSVSVRPCFFAINGKGANEVEHLTSPLRFSKFHKYLSENLNSVGDGAAARNHKSSIEHGFAFLNCTNTDRTELHNIPSPELTKSNKTKTGLEDGESMADSCARNMVCMTELLDAVTGLMLPGKEKYFNDEERNNIYASTIHKDNRGEHFVAAISNGLGCHTDRHNDRGEQYGMNITAWEYIRDTNVMSPKEEGYYVRVAQGMYGRNICDTTYKRANHITQLIEDLESFIADLPKNQTDVSSDLLKPMEGDIQSRYNNKNVVARKPHVDKGAGYYSFFVTTIGRWISRRRISGDNVCFDELIEALLTAVRWTPSPSAWAYVFETITSSEGFALEVPNELILTKSLKKKVTNRKLPLTMSNQSQLPLFLQYILGSIQLLGGVAKGAHVRFQPSVGLTSIDVEKELISLKQLKILITTVRNETYKAVRSQPRPGSDEDMLKRAKLLRPITRKFIRDASLPVAQGGVLGFGNLISHHYIMILSLGGWIDCAHSLNTFFSKGNGTADFLLSEYNLNVGTNPNIIDAVSGSSLFDPYGVNRFNVSENTTCKMGNDHRNNDDNSRQFYDAADLSPDSFIPRISNGVHQALLPDSSLKTISSGVVAEPSTNAESGVLDLSVVKKRKVSRELRWIETFLWWKQGYTLSVVIDGKAAIQSKNKKKEIAAKRQQSVAIHRPSVCYASKDIFGNKYGSPSTTWGYVPRRNQKNKQRLALAAEYLCRSVIQERTLSGMLGNNCPSNLKSFVEHFTGLQLNKLKALQDEVNKNLGSFDDTEDVNELNCKRAANGIFELVMKEIRMPKSKPAVTRSSARKRPGRRDGYVDYDEDEEDGSEDDTSGQCSPSKLAYPLRGEDEFVIDDNNDSPFDDSQNYQLTQMIKVCNRRSLPTATAIDTLCGTFGRTFDFEAEITKYASKVSEQCMFDCPYWLEH